MVQKLHYESETYAIPTFAYFKQRNNSHVSTVWIFVNFIIRIYTDRMVCNTTNWKESFVKLKSSWPWQQNFNLLFYYENVQMFSSLEKCLRSQENKFVLNKYLKTKIKVEMKWLNYLACWWKTRITNFVCLLISSWTVKELFECELLKLRTQMWWEKVKSNREHGAIKVFLLGNKM